jgi:PadR family transcriptional regulator PadR
MNARSIRFAGRGTARRRHQEEEGKKQKESQEVANAGSDVRSVTDRRSILQHFEYAVINAVSILGMKAYPAEIARFLSKSLEKHVSLAQVFIALERLEDKAFVRSEDSKPDPVRGGRRRRIFQVEESGLQAIRKTAATFGLASSTGQPRKVLSNVAAQRREEPSPA